MTSSSRIKPTSKERAGRTWASTGLNSIPFTLTVSSTKLPWGSTVCKDMTPSFWFKWLTGDYLAKVIEHSVSIIAFSCFPFTAPTWFSAEICHLSIQHSCSYFPSGRWDCLATPPTRLKIPQICIHFWPWLPQRKHFTLQSILKCPKRLQQ